MNVTSQQIGASVGVALLTVVAAAGVNAGTDAEMAGNHHAYLAAGIACGLAAAICLFDRGPRGRRLRDAHADPARSNAEGDQ